MRRLIFILPLLLALTACPSPILDEDGDGFTVGQDPNEPGASPVDCNDTDAAVYPGADEPCNDIDNNCDGSADDAIKASFYQDSDADGHGNHAVKVEVCTLPDGYIGADDDCNDADANTYPQAAERCDGQDNDCDQSIDEDVQSLFYPDADGDDFGADATPVLACAAPEGYADVAGDCDDGDALISPQAPETCNFVDDDCDGAADNGVGFDEYPDQDLDGFGDGLAGVHACALDTGFSAQTGDCDDLTAGTNPAASESCDGLDNNCNGQVDEPSALEGSATCVPPAGWMVRVAGGGLFNGDGIPAVDAWLASPRGAVLDALGNLYIADRGALRVRRVGTDDQIYTVAGTGTLVDASGGRMGDGRSVSGGESHAWRLARSGSPVPALVPVEGPADLAWDETSGRLYIAELDGYQVRVLDTTTGSLEVVAGTGVFGETGDGGAAASAKIGEPTALALDPSTQKLYLTIYSDVVEVDTAIRVVDLNSGLISTLTAPEVSATGLALSSDGKKLYYAAMTGNGTGLVKSLDLTTGASSTVAGGGVVDSPAAGATATSVRLKQPAGMTVTQRGDLYFTDYSASRVWKVSSNKLYPVAGTGVRGFNGDGTGTSRQLAGPISVELDASEQNLFIIEKENARVRRLELQSGLLSTVAGLDNATDQGDGEPALLASLNLPADMSPDAVSGDLYVADAANHRIRKVAGETGLMSTVAGTGVAGDPGLEDIALNANLDTPASLVFDDVSGLLYFSDQANHRVMSVSPSGLLMPVAGTGEAGFSGDLGDADAARLNLPQGLALDGSGAVLYVADSANQRIRRIDLSSGKISTLAGNGSAGFSGDGGKATLAKLFAPLDVAFDSAQQRLYIADSGNDRIRMVTLSTNVISTVAGNGLSGYESGEQVATDTPLHTPVGVALDAELGWLLISDQGNQRVRRLDLATNRLVTLVGTGDAGCTRDAGPQSDMVLFEPAGLALGVGNSLYVADSENARILQGTLSR